MATTRTPAARRALRRSAVLALALLLALAGSVVALNVSVYGAGGFVSGYLRALERGAVDEALATAGVDVPEGGRELLDPAAFEGPQEVRITGEEALEGGLVRVTAAFELAGAAQQSSFVVEPAAPILGVFRDWRFAEPPVASLAVQVVNDYRFQAGGVALGDPEAIGAAQVHPVLVPSAVELYHRTTYLTAPQRTAVLAEPGESLAMTIAPEAAERFVTEVQAQVDEHLASCATQRVLFPTGCPFGAGIDDRVLGEPRWEISQLPSLTIEAGADGRWSVPRTPATARLQAEVQSIFDGSVSTLDEEEPFEVAYDVTIRSDDSLLIEAAY